MLIDKSNNNINFTSTVPIKVFVNGEKSACFDSKIVDEATGQFIKILTGKAKGNPKLIEIKDTFIKHDKSFSGQFKIQARKVVDDNGFVYLFTDKHANTLNEFGKKIGHAKAKGLNTIGTAKTVETEFAYLNYFSKIKELLSFPKIKMREFINRNREYEGELVELCIHTKDNTVKGKTNLDIERISLEKME